MKNLAILLLFVLFSLAVKAQSITDTQDFKDLITDLGNENWADANKLSLQCLSKVPQAENESFIAAMLRYIVIYSESGLMNDGKVTQKQALDKVKQYAGHYIVLPAHPLTLKFAFNSIGMRDDKFTDTLNICASNLKATNIHCFEYIILKDKWPEDDFRKNEGKPFRLAGNLKYITVEGHILPRFRLIIDNGTYEKFDDN